MNPRPILLLMALIAAIASTNAQDDFVKGADISWLTSQEDRGIVFHDRQGRQRDCLEMLHNDYQLDAVRLRVWVDPRDGYCNKHDVLRKALRAKALGMQVMLCFHYSDSWADPGKQPMPKAWKGHTYRQTKRLLARHTAEVVSLLINHGVTPRWVQVGNETSNGMLWDMGHIQKNPRQYAGFIRAGYDAVKKASPSSIVILHLDNGFDPRLYDYNLGIVLRYGGRFDMIGMSLYPYWAIDAGREPDAQQTITDCMTNIRRVAAKYGRDVMIVETGFEVDERHPEVMEQGRQQLSRIISEARHQTDGHCRGVFYWEPQCLPGGYRLGAFDSSAAPTAIMDAFIEPAP